MEEKHLIGLAILALALYGGYRLYQNFKQEGRTPNAPGANRVAVGNP